MKQHVLLVDNLSEAVGRLQQGGYDRIFVLTDTQTERLCRPLLGDSDLLYSPDITIASTDAHKDLETLSQVWTFLQTHGATRHSLIICLGGGMVTDLGGFAAATFKRGIDFINAPTTLLAMVDAAVGGKTGVNFNGLKNEIGAFCPAQRVWIHTPFLRTLDADNLRSGYAEMLKHALLNNVQAWAEHLDFDLAAPDFERLQKMVGESIALKQRIVAEDPQEHGLRKALNFGHTVGHAFETLSLRRQSPQLHGSCVAQGMICELYLSHVHRDFPLERLRQTVRYLIENYGRFEFSCDDYDTLYELMLHDKKNVGGVINFTFLGDVGRIFTDQHAEREEIYEAFDFLREG